ncbi:hypothetical protein H5410_025792 [Solanum commersonii]|uniref:NADP-dependent oxidoreductase domain-containing protein n=1 Tax=Solanum commersonii TaxID=4109 RepID=A0A9J5YYY4_SOLCO|nr:hypothetical protein H5410_025792 [Solanum commersonii]
MNQEHQQTPTPDIPMLAGCRRVPALGFGTAADPPVEPEIVRSAVVEAIEVGYRHFDTAALYNSEEALGEAIIEAINGGFVESREQLFITSKLWCSDAHPQHVLPALNKTLRNLKMDYIDLYLIHWPVSSKPGIHEYPIKKRTFFPWISSQFGQQWKSAINLDSPNPLELATFLARTLLMFLPLPRFPLLSIKCIVLKSCGLKHCQVEVNPCWQQQKLREFCKRNGVLVVGYSSLGSIGTFYGTNRVMESEVLREIAKARGKTVAQVALRWGYEQGIGVVVKSYNKERMKQNLEIFNWSLSDDECRKISEITQSRACLGKDYTSPYGPYKTMEELWDEEL